MQIPTALTFFGLIISSLNQRAYSGSSPETEMTISSGVLRSTKRNDRHQSQQYVITRPHPAVCMPELRTVSLIEEGSSYLYVPSCTRIKRCGGCCGQILLTCEPMTSETRHFNVSVFIPTGNRDKWIETSRIIDVEEHTSCHCVCETKAQHCKPDKQVYVEDECRCECLNRNEKARCLKNPQIYIWDDDACTCQCREIEPCSEGLKFDNNTCRCELSARP